MRLDHPKTWDDVRRKARRLWQEHHRDALLIVARPQTYLNLAYLVAAFPAGIVYFVILTIGLGIGLALLPILVGVPVLLFTLVVAWRLGGFERELTRFFLGIEIPPPIRPVDVHRSPRQRVETLLRDQVTWTNLLYLLLKLPLGIVTTALAVGGVALAVYLALNALGSIFRAFFSFWPFVLIGPLWNLFWSGLGVLLILHLLNALAYGCGRFARVMLGPSEDAIRLAASRAETARERAKAEKAERSRQELIVNVSHELRTPTASIRGHAESLLMALEAANQNGRGGMPGAHWAEQADHLRTYLGIIHRESVRLGDLVDDLLTLARSEADELRLEVAPTDAAAIVDEVHETLAPLAWRDRSVELIKQVTPGLPPVMADRVRLLQVLLNLVRNAITHTPPGGIVSVLLERAGPDNIALIVADTGSGIPPEDLEKIFDRFYRVDASRTRASGGFGLGLAIVHDLVTAMGGIVSVESKVGEGSAFRVTLPVAASPALTSAEPAVPALEPMVTPAGRRPAAPAGRRG